MHGIPLLSIVIFLPLIGAAFLAVIDPRNRRADESAYIIALLTSLVVFTLTLTLWFGFDASRASFQFVESAPWLGDFASYRIGVDGISLPLIILTGFLTPVCIIASRRAVSHRMRDYMAAFLIMETMALGVFAALDLFLFYLFFEAGLIPMFLIIGVWGGERRLYACLKFFLYTLFGSLLMLVGVIVIYLDAGTLDIPTLMTRRFDPDLQFWLWLAFFASFAVKTPMWPFHTWLPDAHVEAPTAGSVILAGVLLKMGGYGFLRFSLPMFPDASAHFADFVFLLSLIAIVYASLAALAQQDMKKLIAYSSVAHMGFVTLGIFSATPEGLQGAMFVMLSHGLVSSALFLCVGVVYDRAHTRDIDAYGGLVKTMPVYALLFMIFITANVGLPGTSGFVGEFLALMGVFAVAPQHAAVAVLGVVLSAAYALTLYRRVMFGRPRQADKAQNLPDLSGREKLFMIPTAALIVLYGIYPAPLLDISAASLAELAADADARIVAVAAPDPPLR